MLLKLAREPDRSVTSEVDLRAGLQRLGDANEFAALVRSDEQCLQVGVERRGFVISQIMGNGQFVHWAERPGFSPAKGAPYDVFTFAEMSDLFGAYLRGEPLPGISWRSENLDDRPWSDTAFRLFFKYALWPLLALIYIGSMYLDWTT